MNRTALMLLTLTLLVTPLTSFAQSNSAAKVFCPNPPLAQTLYRGTRDDASGQVTALQNFLSSHFTLSTSFATGYFGPTTEKYVRQFQKEQGIVQVGYVGGLTRKAISSLCGSQVVTPSVPSVTPTPVVTNPDAPTCLVTVSAPVIKSGDAEIITWKSTKADNAKWSTGGYPVGASGSSVEASVIQSKTYSLIFTGKGGSTTCSADVSVESPDIFGAITSFVGTANFVFPGGGRSYLSWTTEHASSCSLLGINVDDGSTMSTVSVPIHSDSYAAQPLRETTYRLKCQMNDGRTESKDFNISRSGDWGGY